MITDLFKNGNYKQFRIITFIKDFIAGVFFAILFEGAIAGAYCFYKWQMPEQCLSYNQLFGIARVLALVVLGICIYFNRFSHGKNNEG